jgi:hypothetical protein
VLLSYSAEQQPPLQESHSVCRILQNEVDIDDLARDRFIIDWN